MPLSYDDIPGSWGVYSKDWPSIKFQDKTSADRAYVACTKEHVVPYGSYVLMDNELRVETETYKQALKEHLANPVIKTYKEVLDFYRG